MRPSLLIAAILSTTAAAAIAQTATPRATKTSAPNAAPANASAAEQAGPVIGTFGFDMAGRDTSVPPGDDF